MPADVTQTDTASVDTAAEALVPALLIADHPHRAFTGTHRALARGGPTTLGRGGDALPPGALDDPRISRRHATIRLQADGWIVEDHDSRNGTHVNGQRIQSAPLRAGDLLRLGDLLLFFRLLPARFHPAPDPQLIGISPAWAAVGAQIESIAARPGAALLLGEPGVGKERVALRLHQRSRRPGAFVPVNCATLADNLMNSELFGHRKGAFSGADAERRGLVRAAQQGTLFLDEIGEATPQLQATLLRTLQEREVRPVGADRPETVDVRFLAATNRDLPAEVAAGRFRADLLSRLDRWTIPIPALRDRREDIPSLARAFALTHGGPPPSTSLLEAICLAPWPGNVRQLDAAIERLCGEAAGSELAFTPSLIASLRAAPTPPKPLAPAEPSRPRQSREAMVAAFRGARGNVSAAAQSLGVSRPTLYRWARQAGIDPDSFRDGEPEEV